MQVNRTINNPLKGYIILSFLIFFFLVVGFSSVLHLYLSIVPILYLFLEFWLSKKEICIKERHSVTYFLFNHYISVLDNSYGKLSSFFSLWLSDCKNINVVKNK